MTEDRPRDMAASVRQRLMNKAREQKEDFHIWLGEGKWDAIHFSFGIHVHFNAAGYDFPGRQVADAIINALK